MSCVFYFPKKNKKHPNPDYSRSAIPAGSTEYQVQLRHAIPCIVPKNSLFVCILLLHGAVGVIPTIMTASWARLLANVSFAGRSLIGKPVAFSIVA